MRFLKGICSTSKTQARETNKCGNVNDKTIEIIHFNGGSINRSNFKIRKDCMWTYSWTFDEKISQKIHICYSQRWTVMFGNYSVSNFPQNYMKCPGHYLLCGNLDYDVKSCWWWIIRLKLFVGFQNI